MSLTVLGAAALGVAAARGHKAYLAGCDVLGEDVQYPVKPVTDYVQPVQYRTQVAAGLTVVALWTLVSFISKRMK